MRQMWQCEICKKTYVDTPDAQKCEAKGMGPIPVGTMVSDDWAVYLIGEPFDHTHYDAAYIRHYYVSNAKPSIYTYPRLRPNTKTTRKEDYLFWLDMKTKFEQAGYVVNGYWDALDRNTVVKTSQYSAQPGQYFKNPKHGFFVPL